MQKATLNGVIASALITIKDGALSISAMSAGTVLATISTLKVSANVTMELPMKDIKMFIKALEAFTGEIEMVKDGNVFSIFNKTKEVKIVLAAPEFIDNTLEKNPNLQYDKTVTIPTTIFKNVLKNMSIIGGDKMRLTFTEKEFNIQIGASGFDNVKETMPLEYLPMSCEYGEMLIAAAQQMGDNIEIGMKTAFPLTIKENGVDYNITYIIAPIVNPE